MIKKRFIPIIIIIMMMFSGCNKTYDYNGYEEITNAIENYEKLSSAKIFVYDIDENYTMAEFTFQIDENKNMLYNYVGKEDNVVYKEYHNGKELYYTTDGKWADEYLSSGENGYYGYSDTHRHSMASADIFYKNDYAVAESDVKAYGDDTKIILTFDPAKVNETAEKTVEEKGKFVSLKTEYVISDGQISQYIQSAEFEKDNEVYKESIKVEIKECDKPQNIEKPDELG